MRRRQVGKRGKRNESGIGIETKNREGTKERKRGNKTSARGATYNHGVRRDSSSGNRRKPSIASTRRNTRTL